MKTISDEFIDETWAVMAACPQHTFLILTKRPGRMLTAVNVMTKKHGILPNVWLGCTIVNQQEADEKIPIFLQVPGKKFLSLEPLLGPIDILYSVFNGADSFSAMEGIDAVILGGETLGARPGREMKQEWAESVVDQCVSAGVPVFVKQLHINGRVSKDITEWPERLRRRDLPWVIKEYHPNLDGPAEPVGLDMKP